ncbi:hypothetical protein KC850_01925 [Candidatus Kaiserbacteria bacterium]|nr:hypothetical protein [Candidatus Kaiserbacteria bacterium]
MAIKYLFAALFVGALIVAGALSVGTGIPAGAKDNGDGTYVLKDGTVVITKDYTADEESREIAARF